MSRASPASRTAAPTYDFVATMRAIILTIAAVVLGVGLLALATATIDRAVQRRKEVVALQLVGVGPRVIRRAQLLESAVPLTIGIVLAVGLGALSGATFLVLDESIGMPWVQTWWLAGAAVVGGLLVAAICTIASAPRLRLEELRAE
jgi:putative ABC transport system permease protein